MEIVRLIAILCASLLLAIVPTLPRTDAPLIFKCFAAAICAGVIIDAAQTLARRR